MKLLIQLDMINQMVLFLFDEKKASYEIECIKIIDPNDLMSPKQNICLGPPYPISYIQ